MMVQVVSCPVMMKGMMVVYYFMVVMEFYQHCKPLNQKEMSYLTLRDWRENHVKVIFKLDGSKVEVKSTDSDITYFTSTDRNVVQSFIDNSSKQLTTIYELNFENIQQDFLNVINN
jgi:hypothetical protein